MQIYGHINGVSHHERQQTRPTETSHSMPAEGRRKVIAALTGQGWTSTAIAEALGIAQAVIDTDILDIPPAPVQLRDPAPVKLRTTPGKPHSTLLLEAYAAAPAGGLTAQEAGHLAGIDPYAASKRVPDLRRRELIERLITNNGRTYRNGSSIYTITDNGRAHLTRELLAEI